MSYKIISALFVFVIQQMQERIGNASHAQRIRAKHSEENTSNDETV